MVLVAARTLVIVDLCDTSSELVQDSILTFLTRNDIAESNWIKASCGVSPYVFDITTCVHCYSLSAGRSIITYDSNTVTST